MFDDRRATAVEADKVTCPVLAISGADDKVISAATGREIAALYPQAVFEEAAGAGHFLIMEKGRGRSGPALRRLDGRGYRPLAFE
ncbi:MAG: hypothetical protein WDN31_09465 [Hyphomicrobium sp.]